MLKEALAQKSPKGEKTEGVIAGVNVQYSDASEKRKLTIILNKLKKIPTGRKTLENLAEYGTIVSLERIGAWGGFSAKDNRIYLSANAKNDKLCSTLVHEARHATQSRRQDNKTLLHDDYDLETQIRLERAKEADAQVFAYQAVGEWAQTGDQRPFQEFCAAYPQTCNFYHYERMNKKIKDGTNESRSVLFRAFFDDKDRVALYENTYMNNDALSNFAKHIKGEAGSEKRRDVHLTTDQIAAITCGEYMADYDAFLRSDKVMGVKLKTKDILAITSAAQGKDIGADKLPVSSEYVGLMEVNGIATSSVGDVRNSAGKIVERATGLKTRQEVEALYNDPVEKQAETVKDFDAEARDAFRRGKIAERFIHYFRNLSDISDASITRKITSNEEKKAAAQKIIDEKTAENADLRDYVTVAAFIETNRETNPELVNQAMALPELSESVKKELRFDNTVLTRPSEQKALPLSEKEKASLKALRKGLSRSAKEPAQIKAAQILAARATQR